jgi:Phage terminase large subunit
MPKKLKNKGLRKPLPATSLRPGDFPLGSTKSRAAARAVVERKGNTKTSGRAAIEYIGVSGKDRQIVVPGEMAGLRLRFQPKQATFDGLLDHSLSSWLGYAGSRGGAKSGSCRRSMVRRRLQYPGTVGQIIRRVWEDVRLNHVDKFFEEFPALEQYYHVAEHEVTIPTTGAPSKIKFDSAETETDVRRKAHGPEFMDIFVDQAEQFSEKELRLLKTTCRWPNMPEHQCKFGLFFNPGGIGAPFLRRIFHTHDYEENEQAEDFDFLQAYGWDNVEWCREALRADGLTEHDFYCWTDKQRFDYFITRSQYGRELNALPQAMRLGHLLGSFDKFAGQYFTDFDKECTEIDYDAFLRLWGRQTWQPIWISSDWGSTHHAFTAWHTFVTVPVDYEAPAMPEPDMTAAGRRALVQAERDHRGQTEEAPTKNIIVTFREWLTSGLGEEAWAEEIVRRTPPNERRRVDHIFLSPDAGFESQLMRGWRIGDVFVRHGMPRARAAFNPRIDGWRLMHDKLRDRVVSRGLMYAGWCIVRGQGKDIGCPKTLEAIPLAVADPDHDGDIIKKGDAPELDVLDGNRYGIASYEYPEDKPVEERRREYIASFPATAPGRLSAHIKFDVEERQRSQPFYIGGFRGNKPRRGGWQRRA